GLGAGLQHELVVLPIRFVAIGAEIDLLAIDLDVPQPASLFNKRLWKMGHCEPSSLNPREQPEATGRFASRSRLVTASRDRSIFSRSSRIPKTSRTNSRTAYLLRQGRFS